MEIKCPHCGGEIVQACYSCEHYDDEEQSCMRGESYYLPDCDPDESWCEDWEPIKENSHVTTDEDETPAA